MLITDAAVREAAANLAQSLGGDWAIDTAAPADGAAHLVYSDGRGISFRPIFGGTTVQLWITGSAAPPLPDDATLADHATYEAQLTARLPEGHRYNKATTLVTEADEDPELIILRTLEDDLLPAFDYKPRYVGHRPWIDLFESALSQVMDESRRPRAPRFATGAPKPTRHRPVPVKTPSPRPTPNLAPSATTTRRPSPIQPQRPTVTSSPKAPPLTRSRRAIRHPPKSPNPNRKSRCPRAPNPTPPRSRSPPARSAARRMPNPQPRPAPPRNGAPAAAPSSAARRPAPPDHVRLDQGARLCRALSGAPWVSAPEPSPASVPSPPSGTREGKSSVRCGSSNTETQESPPSSGPPPEPSLHHTATSMFKAVADARWIHRGPASPAPGEPPTDRAACLSGPGHRDHRGMLGLARLAFMPFGSGVCMRRLQRRLRCKQCRPSTEPRR